MAQQVVRDSYIRLDYRPQPEGPEAQPAPGGIDFSQLAANKNREYTKKPLVLKTEGQETHIALKGVTDREIVHLIKACEKQSSWVNRGGWWNIFFGLPALFLGISRYFELRHTTEQILRAALKDQCPEADLNKLLKRSGGDNQLAKFLAVALTNQTHCLSKEIAATIVSNWANGRELDTELANHGYDKGVLEGLLTHLNASKDSPGLANMRAMIGRIPEAVRNAPPPPPQPRRPAPPPIGLPDQDRLSPPPPSSPVPNPDEIFQLGVDGLPPPPPPSPAPSDEPSPPPADEHAGEEERGPAGGDEEGGHPDAGAGLGGGGGAPGEEQPGAQPDAQPADGLPPLPLPLGVLGLPLPPPSDLAPGLGLSTPGNYLPDLAGSAIFGGPPPVLQPLPPPSIQEGQGPGIDEHGQPTSALPLPGAVPPSAAVPPPGAAFQPPVLTAKAPPPPPNSTGPSAFSLSASTTFGAPARLGPTLFSAPNPFAARPHPPVPPTPMPTKPTVRNEPPSPDERQQLEAVMQWTGPTVPDIHPLKNYLTRLLPDRPGLKGFIYPNLQPELNLRLERLSFYGNAVQFLTYLALSSGPQAAIDVIFALPIPGDLGRSMVATPVARFAGNGLRELDPVLPSICHNLALPAPGQKIEGTLAERQNQTALRFYSQRFSDEDQQLLGQFVTEQADPHHDHTTFGGNVYSQAIKDSISLRLVDTNGRIIDVTKNRAGTVEDAAPAVAQWALPPPATQPEEYDCQLGNNQEGYVALLNAFTGNSALTLQVSAFLDQATLAVIMKAKPCLLPGLAAKDQSNTYELQRRPNGEIVLTITQRQHIHPAEDQENRERGGDGVETQFYSAALEKTVVIKFASGQPPQVENTSIKCARIDPVGPRVVVSSPFSARPERINPDDSVVLVPEEEARAAADPLAYLPPAPPALPLAGAPTGPVPPPPAPLPPTAADILARGNLASLLALPALPPGITPAHIAYHRQHPLTAANFYRFLVNEYQIADRVLKSLPTPEMQPVTELRRQLGLAIAKYSALLLEKISGQDAMTEEERQRLLVEWSQLKAAIDPVVPCFAERFARQKVAFLGTTDWPEIHNDLQMTPGQPPDATNVQRPAAKMDIYGRDIAGVSSLDTTSPHIPNLWVDDYRVQGRPTFHGYRHGTLTPFGQGVEQGSPAERAAAINRAKELLTAMLVDDPALLASVRGGQPMRVSSMSLMTPDKIRHTAGSNSSDERHMWQIQRDVLRELSSQPQIELTLPDGAKVNVKVEALAFNFGINRGATALAQGWRNFPLLGNIITGAMGWDMEIIMDNRRAIGELRKAVEAYTAGGHTPDETRAVVTLMAQIDKMMVDGSYMVAGNDPVKMPARIMALSYLLGFKTAFNCKSGKDRTSIADVETKFLLTELQLTGQFPEPGQQLTPPQQARYMELVRNSGNYDVQSCNTGGLMGYKLGMDSAYRARIGDDPANLANLNGLSALAKE